MEIAIERPTPQEAVFRPKGELILPECNPTRAKVMKALDDGARQITMDLSEVSFIDSAGLGLLIGLRQTARQRGGDFVLEGVNDQVLPLFQMTRLNKIFGLPD
jgi:anti-sigma B factor antagonist